jgi:proline dehydrogenase
LAGQLAAARAQELGIPKGDRNLQFAQLMGMADGLSLSLRNAGFQVSKYLPYGPVEQIIPYLIRRAEENRGLLSASSFDRHLLRYGRPSGI